MNSFPNSNQLYNGHNVSVMNWPLPIALNNFLYLCYVTETAKACGSLLHAFDQGFITQYALMYTGHSLVALAVHLFPEENISSAFNCFFFMKLFPCFLGTLLLFSALPSKLQIYFMRQNDRYSSHQSKKICNFLHVSRKVLFLLFFPYLSPYAHQHYSFLQTATE